MFFRTWSHLRRQSARRAAYRRDGEAGPSVIFDGAVFWLRFQLFPPCAHKGTFQTPCRWFPCPSLTEATCQHSRGRFSRERSIAIPFCLILWLTSTQNTTTSSAISIPANVQRVRYRVVVIRNTHSGNQERNLISPRFCVIHPYPMILAGTHIPTSSS